ncbi:MAG: hypothetical protein V2B19_22470 [Pseudomonadota bacterium]
MTIVKFIFEKRVSTIKIEVRWRPSAVAEVHLGPFQFKGFFAWVVWQLVHIWQLIGFRNRLVVLINRVWDYLFNERGVRLITRDKT